MSDDLTAAVDGAVRMAVDMVIPASELETWPRRKIEAFFAGVAAVESARAHQAIEHLRAALEQAQQENVRLRKENDLRRQQIARFPFCSDHHDKVLGRPCRECEREKANALARTLARALVAVVDQLLDQQAMPDPPAGAMALLALPAVQALLKD